MSAFQAAEGGETMARLLHMPDGGPDLSAVPRDISSLSDTQEIILSVLPIISGFLSMIGSFTIIYVEWNLGRTKRKKWTTYARLLIAMSCCYVVVSITFIIQPFLLPTKTSQRVWAFGNDSTCSVLGFLFQLSFAATLYNGFLSFYCLRHDTIGRTTNLLK